MRAFVRFLFVAAVSFGFVAGQTPQTLAVTGDVKTPLTLKAEDLAAMPREKATIPDQDGTQIEYEGVAPREIPKRAGAPLGHDLRGKALASYVVAKALFGYQGPFRLVCPNDKAGGALGAHAGIAAVCPFEAGGDPMRSAFVLVLCAAFSNMSAVAAEPPSSDAWVWNLPKGFPKPRVPANNPMTVAKVELGRYLFCDTRMSVNGKSSSAASLCRRRIAPIWQSF